MALNYKNEYYVYNFCYENKIVELKDKIAFYEDLLKLKGDK